MTRCFLIILLNLIFALPNYSQIIKYPNKSDSTIISIPEYYKNSGKVFSSDYCPKQLYLNDYVKGYKLAEDEIIKAEILLQENYPNQSWFGPLLIGLFYRRLNIHKSFALNLS